MEQFLQQESVNAIDGKTVRNVFVVINYFDYIFTDQRTQFQTPNQISRDLTALPGSLGMSDRQSGAIMAWQPLAI